MDTLIRIYLFFIGIVAVLVCFITWVSIRLRAERINRIRIEKEKKLSETTIHNLEYDLKSVKNSIASYESLYESSKQIIKLNEAEIKNLEERINRQSDIIQELEQRETDINNLTDYANTLFKDLKGALDMNAKLMEATKGLEQVEQPAQPTRDWSVPQAFPKNYIVSKKIKAVRVIDNNGHIPEGTKGIIHPDGTSTPVFRYKGEPGKGMCSYIGKLAPINPLDHPEHPQFNKK